MTVDVRIGNAKTPLAVESVGITQSLENALSQAQIVTYEQNRAALAQLIEVDIDGVRRLLAIQGLGNLVSLEQVDDGITALIENPALPTIIVGSSLGFYESTTGNRASAKWSIAPDGDLSIKVSRRPVGY